MKRALTAGLLLILTIGLSTPKLFAQNRGNHGLAVQVSYSDGAALNVSLRVELLDRGGIPISEAYTNRSGGTAEFRDLLPEGVYRRRVSGAGIETVTSDFEIFATETDHREFISVRAAEKASRRGDLSAEPTVSVQSLKVPEKAREAFNAAMDAYGKGDIAKAREQFEDAIAIFPRYARAHNNLGVLFLHQNDNEKAREEFSKALELDATFAPAHINLASEPIADPKFPEAEQQLDKAAALDPNSLNAMVLMTSTAYTNKNYDKALAYARKVHDMPQHEQYADVHLVAAQILVQQKKDAEAVAEYQLFLKESPNDPRVPKVKQLMTRLQPAGTQP